ncbi:3-oxoacyl-[acyl-carrier-protein] reductase FabG-like [Oppia nitens]|uniref:3-oxoacyl-[acyl-carrier-protein] reductase FabG-like n=1 Tax=Oppia nitens TaxID=1686743 RepID=UPI0023D97F0A|nr:3-oxoacyl-[acyl-carrier-protein] reductase FabG-like [Oppia nitens]
MKILLIILLIVLFTKANSSIFYNLENDDYKDILKSRNFTDKVVLVTGSSTGIGEGIVKLFAVLGAKVVITGRKEAEIRKVAQEVQQLSPYKLKPLEVVADLTKSDELLKLINKTVDTFGRLDVLVNNAGIYPNTSISDPKFMQTFDQVFNIDFRAVVQTIHMAVPYLEKTNGTIISISSIAGIHPSFPMLAYSSAKAAMDMMTQVLALELGPKGIRVNTINPGVTLVPNIDITDPYVKILLAKVVKITPLRRIGVPIDIAKGVVFLASSDASFITGANLVIDGGVVYNTPGDLSLMYQ